MYDYWSINDWLIIGTYHITDKVPPILREISDDFVATQVQHSLQNNQINLLYLALPKITSFFMAVKTAWMAGSFSLLWDRSTTLIQNREKWWTRVPRTHDPMPLSSLYNITQKNLSCCRPFTAHLFTMKKFIFADKATHKNILTAVSPTKTNAILNLLKLIFTIQNILTCRSYSQAKN